MMSNSFESLRSRLDHIVVEFQLGDIERALRPSARANFLAAQGLMVCTEFIGGARNGTLGNPSGPKQRFKEGTRLMGAGYLQEASELWSLRCGLLHSYLPEGKPGRDYSFDNDPTNPKGFEHSMEPTTGRERLAINAPAYLHDLRIAYGRLLGELRASPHDARRAEEALAKLPGLA